MQIRSIVTGAARGLGRAYAKRLAGLKARVADTDLNLRSYEEFEAEAKDMTADSTVAEIEASGGIAFGIEVDVRQHEAVECNAVAPRSSSDPGRSSRLALSPGPHRPPMAAMPTTGLRRPLPPTTRGIWPRISGLSGSRRTASLLA